VTAPAPVAADLGRAAAQITALTLVSRATGFVRVLVVTAVLGTTFLGNVYEANNTVPNVLFELFAAGALHAVLVPTFVAVRLRSGRDGMVAAAGAVLRFLTLALVAVTLTGLVLSPLIARLLAAGIDDDVVRRAAGRLGTILLLVFLPQVVCYGAGLVSTAALQAAERFAAAAVAPIVNNLVVIAAYAAFAALRHGEGAWPATPLRPIEVAVLAGGTTLGVVAFTAVPLIAVRRIGFRIGVAERHEALHGIGRRGAWAAGLVALTQAQIAAVLVLAGGVAGGVVAYQFAFTWFLLPYALVAVPVATAMYPRLAERGATGAQAGFAVLLERGIFVTTAGLALGAAALGALAWPLVHLTTFGRVDASGRVIVARTLVALAPGLVGYGLLYVFVRASYALGDARTPTVVCWVSAAAALTAMALATVWVSDAGRVPALAAIQSATTTLAAVVIGRRVERRAGARLLRPSARPLAAGVIAAVVMAGIVAAIGVGGRDDSLVAALVAGSLGLVAAWLVLRAGTVEPLRRRLRLEGPDA
jgi:putative peptidoglycan lipid II flippase